MGGGLVISPPLLSVKIIFMNFPIEKFRSLETPFYYYDTDLLRETLRVISQEAGRYPQFHVHYAVKANANASAFVYNTRARIGCGLCQRRRNTSRFESRFSGRKNCICRV